ncbi:MAG: hypothetical protein J6Y28_00395 [Acholeplasmatales bacterium]|nr:hypothetical protein [Acholeplasmatales bacterium]
MKKRKNKDEEVSLDSEAEVVESEVVEDKDKEVSTTIKPKKTIFFIFYEIVGVLCIVLLILTLFDKPRDFIVDKVDLILGIVILCYALLFLLPYALKKKETKFINFLTIIELALIVIISLFLLQSKDSKFLNISRSIGLVIYIFGLTEIIRGYHSNGGIKLFKNPLLNGLIKYFNIFLITLGTYVFFVEPFDKYLIVSIRITLGALALIAIIIGLLKMPKKKK